MDGALLATVNMASLQALTVSAVELLMAAAALLHFMSISVVLARFVLKKRSPLAPLNYEGVSVIRPVCGLENYIEETLHSTFHLDYPQYEVLFCVVREDDAVVPVVRRLMAEHPHVRARLLVGNAQINANPKLNNMSKGWEAARHDWILMVDSNVLMPPDHIQRMFAAWRSDTGLVASPPAGGAPANFWAELEAAFLNAYQARWQCFADSLGLGFAQGKAMLWRRELLERAGGLKALAQEAAEDAAATKIVRRRGLKVHLARQPFVQPLGRRNAREVWQRQLRWARLRRDAFPLYFLPELFAGAWLPLAAGAYAAAAGAISPSRVLMLLAAWYGAEALLARAAGWPMTLRSVAAAIARDTLLPVLWIATWLGNGFEWRGHVVTLAAQQEPS